MRSDKAAQHRYGLLLVTVSAVAWSTAEYFARLVDLDSWTMIAGRGLFGAAGMLLFILARERGATLAAFRRMGLPGLIFAAVATVGMMLLIAAYRYTTVAHVAIIYATVPFLAAGLAWLMMRERPSLSAALAGFVSLVGVIMMVGLSGEGSLWGDILALAMTLSVAIMMVIARRYQNISALPAACLASLLSGLVGLPFAQLSGLDASSVINLALFGIVSSAIAIGMFTVGSRLLPAIETALIGCLEAPLSPIWVWLAFAETPTVATILGGIIVMVAVIAHIVFSARAEIAEPEPI